MNQPSAAETRNLIIAAVLSFLVLVLWGPLFGPEPLPPEERQESGEQSTGDEATDSAVPRILPHDQAVAQSDRIQIRTPSLEGSISLEGALIDELRLIGYDTELNSGEPIELLHPRRTVNAYFAQFGWRLDDRTLRTPTINTVWSLAQGSAETLTDETPVTLEWLSPDGLIFTLEFQVDERYMFEVTQSVRFESGAPTRSLLAQPVTRVIRDGTPQIQNLWIIHEGPIGVINGALEYYEYSDIDDADPINNTSWRGETGRAEQVGWIGFTDPYWLTAISPQDGRSYNAMFARTDGPAGPRYIAQTQSDAFTLEGENGEAVYTTNFFAGAKQMSALRAYQYQLDGVEAPSNFLSGLSNYFFYSSESRFVDAVDWGWFFFLTKPIFELLAALNSLIGNMGVAIILLTLIFKIILFPLAYKSYVSMSRMKKLQPDMKKIQERYKDDRQKMQQEMMALYKREKVNPAAGCLPLLAQIPIFFSLYKVLNVSIELRHAPFFGWIQDLSAPDPTTILNLFGLLPYDVPNLGILSFISIGIWPILMGITMWLQQSLNPAPADATQAKIFAWLPVVFTFMLAHFASGLVIYWTANNTLTIIQQYTIMRRQGVEVDFLGNLKEKVGINRKKES